jgi:hypothetical protein
VTLAATSRNEEIGTTEVDESDAFDPGATQLNCEVRSARKTLPRRPKSEFDKVYSEFRSSQILRRAQPEPARPVERVTAVSKKEEKQKSRRSWLMLQLPPACHRGFLPTNQRLLPDPFLIVTTARQAWRSTALRACARYLCHLHVAVVPMPSS